MALTVAPEIAEGMAAFSEHYARTSGGNRKLVWAHSTGVCTLEWAGLVELQLTTAQASALLLFNDTPTLALPHITAALGVKPAEAEWLVASLVKAAVLVAADGSYTVNTAYAPRARRVVVPLPPAPCAEQHTLQEVESDRRQELEAAIIRIMKSRRAMAYSELVATTQSHVASRFVATVKSVKKRVEELISRDFLRRDEDDCSKLVYVA